MRRRGAGRGDDSAARHGVIPATNLSPETVGSCDAAPPAPRRRRARRLRPV